MGVESAESGPLRLHLVRHGRTRYNEQGRIQGWCDSELTEAGVADVERTAARLRSIPFRAAYVSPSGRTVTTAQALLGEPPRTTWEVRDGLREFSYGAFEAEPEESLYSQISVVSMYRQVFEGTFAGLPGGESGATFLGRVARTFMAIERAHADGGPVLVVSHGVTLMAYLAMLDQLPPRPLANGSVTIVEVGRNGRRVLPDSGFDPSGAADAQPVVTLNAAHVALENAVDWDTDAAPRGQTRASSTSRATCRVR